MTDDRRGGWVQGNICGTLILHSYSITDTIPTVNPNIVLFKGD